VLKAQNWLFLEFLKGGVAKVFRRRTSSERRYRVHFAEIVKEEIDGRNSPWRIREVLEAVRSCRGTGKLRQEFSKCKSQENRTIGFEPIRVIGSPT
jgi:hypothetical protein